MPLVTLEREESAKEEQKNPGQTKVNLMSDLENDATNVSVRSRSIARMQGALKLIKARKAAQSKSKQTK